MVMVPAAGELVAGLEVAGAEVAGAEVAGADDAGAEEVTGGFDVEAGGAVVEGVEGELQPEIMNALTTSKATMVINSLFIFLLFFSSKYLI
jgi:hypothetical protein